MYVTLLHLCDSVIEAIALRAGPRAVDPRGAQALPTWYVTRMPLITPKASGSKAHVHNGGCAGLSLHGRAWKTIAKHVVKTRSAEQVRIHAQKHFTKHESKAPRGKGAFHAHGSA